MPRRSTFLAYLALATTTAAVTTTTAPAHSVVHIVVDDLRPELGAYGLEDRHTPNIDRLARGGTVFDRAFAQQAVCGPSRNSFLTGRRPDRSRVWNFINHFREDHPEWTSLPGLFLGEGRLALGAGKLFHPKMPPAYDGEKSWSNFHANLPFENPCWNTADHATSKGCNKTGAADASCDGGLPCVFCPIDIAARVDKKLSVTVANEWCQLDAVEDDLSVHKAITLLRQAAATKKSFYLALGLHKPHMPWQFAPEDLAKHPASSVDLPLHPLPPVGMPPIAFHFSDALGNHTNPYAPLTDDETRAARRAYRAAVTGMDRKLGRLLDELDTLGIANDTAVVMHGDHGWALGEGGEWRKFTNFEVATRVPLIVRAPWLTPADGPNSTSARRSSALVELVDILPTIAALAGVALPSNETFDGRSLVPLLTQMQTPTPTQDDGRDAAFSQYPRRVKGTNMSQAWHGNSIIHHDRTMFTHMGYSIRTASWRYTAWVAWDKTALAPLWDQVVAHELYDHRTVPAFPTNFDAVELVNVVSDAGNADVVQELRSRLEAQFPPGNHQREVLK